MRGLHSLCKDYFLGFRVREAAIRTRTLRVDFPCSLYLDVYFKAWCRYLISSERIGHLVHSSTFV